MTEPARLRDAYGAEDALLTGLVVAEVDLEAARALDLPVTLIVWGPQGFAREGRPVAADRVHLAALGVLILSSGGAEAAEALASDWQARFGVVLPERCDLADVPADARRMVALGWLAGLLLAQRRAGAQRMVALMRDLAVLRQEHEAMQGAFARLESFAHEHRLSERKLHQALAPVEGAPEVVLTPGQRVVQRLPGGSVGLSDVAVRIAEVPQPRQGVLTCRLASPDLGSVLAEWTVPAAQMASGWLRLSLVAGLPDDPVGLELELAWAGAVPLRLATAMAHPDPRFRPLGESGEAVGRHVLALELWHYLPGVRAPANAVGQLPDGAVETRSPLRRVEARDLFRAINLDTLVADLPRVEGSDALQVHVMPDHVACAILTLPMSAIRQVSVDVLTRHPRGPVVDYAIAVLPSAARPRHPAALPEFPEEAHSGWVRMKPMRAGQVSLILPDLPPGSHDLYLMTRLPPGATENAFGWSGFSGLVLHV